MISHHEHRWRKGRLASRSARTLTVVALAATLVSTSTATAFAEPDTTNPTTTTTSTTTARPTTTTPASVSPADAGESSLTTTTPEVPETSRATRTSASPATTTPVAPVQLAPRAPVAAIAAVPVNPPPSAAVDVEKPEREPGKAKLTGMDLVRSQQYALTVPADQLPELPAGAAARAQRAALPDGVSQEDAELAERMAMVANANCQFYVPSPHAVCGEIRNKYNAMGGPASFLGWPTSPEYQNPGNTGARSEFLNGSIYWSAATGAHSITPLFMTKWDQHGWEAGWMGYPTSDEIPNGDNIGSRQEFQTANAAIYWNSARPLEALSVIGGAIRDKWGQVGWETPGSLLGYPTSDEIPLPVGQGRMNRFERGTIYWSPMTGAHVVRGAVLDKWAAAGYETGPVGFPIADQLDDGVYATQQFQNGSVTAPGANASELASLIPGTTAAEMIIEAQNWAQSVAAPVVDALVAALTKARKYTFVSQGPDTPSDDDWEVLPYARGKGDIFYADSSLTVSFPGSYINHGHNGIYISTTRTMESSNGVGVHEVNNETAGPNNGRRKVRSPQLGWINTDAATRDRAVAFAISKNGKGYNKNFAWTNQINDEQYNCSQLIWAAYMHASDGDIELKDWFPNPTPSVYPKEVFDNDHVTKYYP